MWNSGAMVWLYIVQGASSMVGLHVEQWGYGVAIYSTGGYI